jgi:hypothetical protein
MTINRIRGRNFDKTLNPKYMHRRAFLDILDSNRIGITNGKDQGA